MKAVLGNRLVPIRLIVLIIAAGCRLPFPSDLHLPQTPQPTLAPAQPRSIARSTLPLQETWRKNVVPLASGSGWAMSSDRIFFARPEVLYVTDYESSTDSALILALDPQTGKQKWKIEPWGSLRSFTAVSSMLVVAASEGIKAYDVVTGKEKWVSDQRPADDERFRVFINDSILNFIDSKGLDDFYTQIDPETGKVGNFQKSDKLLTKIDSQYRYTWNPLNTLWLEDIKTNRADQIITLPTSAPDVLREDNTLAIPYLEPKHTVWRSLVVVDIPTKQKLWECSECLASDIAIDGGKLYAIRREGDLAQYDLNTGKLLGTVQFNGGRAIDPDNTIYGIAASNGKVFLYFGDTKEIIALGPNP